MKKYGDEFKREAVRLAAQPGMKVSAVEEDLGITPGLLYKWREHFGAEEGKDAAMPMTEAEVRQLRRDLSIARQERDILKKAIQIFSKEQSR